VQIFRHVNKLRPACLNGRVGHIIGSSAIFALGLLFTISTSSLVSAQTLWSDSGKNKSGPTAVERKSPGPECLQKAREKLNSEGPEKALDMFRSCARDNANSPEAQMALGLVYFWAKQPKEAAEALKQTLKLDPNNVQARALLGKVYSIEADKLDLAEELLRGVLDTHPELNDSRVDLARVYAQKRQVEKALAEYERVLATERNYALYHVELGRLLAAMGLKEKAKKEFERSLVLLPEFQPAKEHLKLLEQPNTPGPAGSAPPGSDDKKQ
jgi:tetratricopeptide (TPR) repeat protein